MSELSLHERFAIIALNGLQVETMTVAKKLAVRGIMAAEILEKYLNEDSLSKQVDMDFRKILISSKRKLKSAEERFTKELKEKGLLSVIPSILNCDMYYVTSGVEVSEYLCDGAEYTRQTEGIRAELLEDGEISSEIIFLWWLMRESSCFYDLFSPLEIDKITQRLNEIHLNSKVAKELFNLKLQRKIERIYAKYLKKKHEIFTTALGTGFLFVVPFFERKESVFIDVEQWFSDKDKRLSSVLDRFALKGHVVSVIRTGETPLIKVDNIYYECIPTQVVVKVPIQGVRLRRYVMK